MASELDGRFDAVIRAITGPGGPLETTVDERGRAIVAHAPATVPGFIDHFCAQHGAADMLVMGEERISFTGVAAIVDRTARALAARIAPGDRVAIAMRNAPCWIAAYLGVLKAGGVAVLVNGWWQPDELRHGMTLADPALVIADGERARRLSAGGCAAPVVVLDLDLPLERALAPLLDGPAADLPVISPDDDATILFTSGSTGMSKGAVSTHRAVTTAVYTFLSYTATLFELVKADEGIPDGYRAATLIAIPMFHVTGEVPVLLNSIAVGRKIVLMRKWDAGEALRLVEAEAISYFVGVPTMSLEMMQHPDLANRDVSALQDIVAGGAARPVAHVERLAASFPNGHPMLGYGLTETNAVGCTNYRANYRAKPASTGRPQWPFVEVAILDERDRAVANGQRGEIAIRSAANIRGYWRNDAATDAAFTADGYVRTGDVGYFDEDGYLFIVDRAKDIIIRGGENIAAQEVEAALYAHPCVAEAAVFGVADDRLGEVPAAVIVPRDGATLDADTLTAFVGERLAKFKVPAMMWFEREPLPKLGTGKIDKVGIKARYRAMAAA